MFDIYITPELISTLYQLNNIARLRWLLVVPVNQPIGPKSNFQDSLTNHILQFKCHWVEIETLRLRCRTCLENKM